MNKRKSRIIIKFIIAAGIFYLGISFNVFHIWEKLINNEQKDYLKINEEKNLEPEASGHYSAQNQIYQNLNLSWNKKLNESWYESDFNILCKSNHILCDKINFHWKYNYYQKRAYLSDIVDIVYFINDSNKIWSNFEDTISEITINNNKWDRRWYATWYSIVFNVWTVDIYSEFLNLVSHEMGHIVDLGFLQWNGGKKHWSFTEFWKVTFYINDPSIYYYGISRGSEKIRKAKATKKDFCSGYGMYDPFEDFAECFNMYINHNYLFRQIAKSNPSLKKKYNYMAGIFDWVYLKSNKKDLLLVKNDVNRRPWDTTKISN